jgi:hypothetical protein
MNMLDTIIPKSDQLNADDLIGGPITIKITGVVGSDTPDQPVKVNFDGDKGKPYKPCKSMRRVMVHVWGPDAKQYVGRSMTLYCDAGVSFGGMKVGGIRISHMSDMKEPKTMALTATKAKRAAFTVHPLTGAKEDKGMMLADDLIKRFQDAPDKAGIDALKADAKVIEQLTWLAAKRPELAARVDLAIGDQEGIA